MTKTGVANFFKNQQLEREEEEEEASGKNNHLKERGSGGRVGGGCAERSCDCLFRMFSSKYRKST